MKSRIALLSTGMLVLGLGLAACGDDEDDAATGDTTEQTEAAETPTTAADEMTTTSAAADDMTTTSSAGATAEEADIVDTAVAAGDFETLVAAVQAAGLEETLRGPGPYTVFAPTDAAFAALPAGTVDALLADPAGDLTAILTYHVVDGEVPAADVVGLDGQEVATVNGATFTVGIGDDGSVTLTDATGNEVAVTQTDIQASNGIIHVIDGVLLPG